MDQVGWPDCGEIDIMEFDRNRTLSSIMYANKAAKPVWTSTTFNTPDAWANDYHEWEMIWNE